MKGLLEKRVALITGKGGTGRSTIAAALAHVARGAQKRVLLTEITDGGDDYSPLAKWFGLNQLPRTAAPIADGIWGSQLLADTGMELFVTSVIKVPLLARTALGLEPLRRLFSAAPSLRELGIFFHLLTYLRAEPRYDLVLVDAPATGHTLALTGLPEVILRLVTRGPIAEGLREGQAWLNDPARTAAWVVTLPETLPVTEALELIEGLEKTRVARGGVIVNRVPGDAFTAAETEALQAYLQGRSMYGADAFARLRKAREAVDRLRKATALPITEVPELEQTDLLEKLAEALR